MAIELHLQRSDHVPWGFRLSGGADRHQPITVIKVFQGSIAERAGLQIGDILVRVDNIPTAGLTHTQTHDVISSAGNDLVLAVRRDEFEDLVARELGNNINAEQIDSEIDCILKDLKEVSEDAIQTFTQVEISIEDRKDDNGIVKETFTNQEMTSGIKTEESVKKEDNKVESEPRNEAAQKKWSTFLQKPNRPKPKQKIIEQEKPIGEPYRVVIKKQMKKTEEPKNKTETVVESVEAVDEPETKFEETGYPKPEEQGNEKAVSECEISRVDEESETEEQQDQKEDHSEDEDNENKTDSIAEKEVSETSLSLEEQLVQVQKQLQALSQLPSAIQSTLDAVTQQLSAIVTAKNARKQNEEETAIRESNTTSEIEITEHNTDDEGETLKDDIEEKSASSVAADVDSEERMEETIEGEEEHLKSLDESERTEMKEDLPDDRVENGLTEKEREEQKKEEERQAKKEKVFNRKERSPSPLTPLQRPIILPGGRKWVQPGDAVPSFRRPKMTDEKIADAIETYSEVLTGRLKGINFLKYQPPPKNLDYLQHSEVYRLVHDMEPPVKGIARRASKILAEQDYYEKKDVARMEP